MQWLQTHLRNKFLAGILAAVPIAVVVIGSLWIEEKTRPLADMLGWSYPGLGIVLVIVAIYLLGLVVTSFFGRVLFGWLDHLLRRVPGFKLLYQAWKDILVIGPGKKDIYSHVVLVPIPEGQGHQLGFTSGDPVHDQPGRLCVFLPNAPNPVTGRLIFVERSACQLLNVPMEEAFKFLLSTGNYVPAAADKGIS